MSSAHLDVFIDGQLLNADQAGESVSAVQTTHLLTPGVAMLAVLGWLVSKLHL